ncbi:hypothetical protein ATANTOWER_011767 [Ataeniobius toweri]|uniref:Uncharacterized protein n=1 Tax=Ataeniobius toweri TaxID=208326 RepID=A0ABU7B8Q2_9TELE|nr:hypothetical protein [Ataeniobius toweri]
MDTLRRCPHKKCEKRFNKAQVRKSKVVTSTLIDGSSKDQSTTDGELFHLSITKKPADLQNCSDCVQSRFQDGEELHTAQSPHPVTRWKMKTERQEPDYGNGESDGEQFHLSTEWEPIKGQNSTKTCNEKSEEDERERNEYFRDKWDSCHLQKNSEHSAVMQLCNRDGQEAEYRELVDRVVAWCFENEEDPVESAGEAGCSTI